jgi:hypothetical protein
VNPFVELKYIEKSRTYIWPNGLRDTIKDVIRISVSDSGTHRLETGDGLKHIVPKGWIRIQLDVKGWTL